MIFSQWYKNRAHFLLQIINIIGLCIVLVELIYITFTNLSDYVLEMPDDYVYPAATKEFLTTGQYRWAGCKPGIVLLASFFKCDDPYRIIYLYGFFGLLTGLALFLLSLFIFEQWSLAVIPPILWLSSSFYFYYSKTHLLICAAFYLFGVWLCIKGIQKKRWAFYYGGCALLGFSVLTYYVILSYLPFVLLLFAYLFYTHDYSLRTFLLKTVPLLLAPIIIVDSCAMVAYWFWGKKNWPFLYSLVGQWKGVSGGHGLYGFFYHPNVFFAQEKFLTIFLGISLILLLGILIFDPQKYKINNRYVILMALFIPALSLNMRALMGHFSATRAFVAVLPMMYVMMVVSLNYFDNLFFKNVILAGALLFSSARLYSQYEIAPLIKTGYGNAASCLQAYDADLIVYFGTRKLWELFVKDKEITPLNVGDDSLALLKDDNQKNELVTRLQEYLTEGKKVLLVTSHCSYNDFRTIKRACISYFDMRIVHQIDNPHMVNDFVVEESNGGAIKTIEDLKALSMPYIMIYALHSNNVKYQGNFI